MRRLFLAVLVLILAETSWAIDIKGKWGLGVGTGSLIGSSTEASLIRGKTERTGLILDLNFTQGYEERRSDSTSLLQTLQRSATISLGPRIRRYTRPRSQLSPYWDVFLHLKGANSSHKETYEYSDYSTGVEAGIAGGLEYFTPWHFSLAAHTGLFAGSADRLWGKNWDSKYRGWKLNSSLGFSPRLQIRVYF